jgi:hypothetical protein
MTNDKFTVQQQIDLHIAQIADYKDDIQVYQRKIEYYQNEIRQVQYWLELEKKELNEKKTHFDIQK